MASRLHSSVLPPLVAGVAVPVLAPVVELASGAGSGFTSLCSTTFAASEGGLGATALAAALDDDEPMMAVLKAGD